MEESVNSSEGSECGWRALKKQRRKSYTFDGFDQASQENAHQNYLNISTPANQKKLSFEGEDTHICDGFSSDFCCTPRQAPHDFKEFECRMAEDDYNIFKTSPRTLIQSLQQQSSSSGGSEVEESCRLDSYDIGKWSVRDNPIASDDSYHEHDEVIVIKKYFSTAIRGRVLFKSLESAAQEEEEEEREHDLLDNCSQLSSTDERSDCLSSTSSNTLQPEIIDTMYKENMENNRLQLLSNGGSNYGKDRIITLRDVHSSTSSEFRETTGMLEVVKCRAWNFMELIFRRPLWISLFLPVALVTIKLINMQTDYHVLVPT